MVVIGKLVQWSLTRYSTRWVQIHILNITCLNGHFWSRLRRADEQWWCSPGPTWSRPGARWSSRRRTQRGRGKRLRYKDARAYVNIYLESNIWWCIRYLIFGSRHTQIIGMSPHYHQLFLGHLVALASCSMWTQVVLVESRFCCKVRT